jgi:2-polyprenyl-3-methyl-5-hydroxy-6-metoxy-1,4-benzoquinol methylase
MSECAQEQYWNDISQMYREITRIDDNDFHYGPLLDGESKLKLLPPLQAGMTSLELGCGEGQNSRWLARQGLKCIAVDISEGQLSYARKDAEAEGLAIDFRCGSVESFDPTGAMFDLITSSHAFEFVNEPFEQVKRITGWLKPGGTLMISTVHPVYNGEWVAADEEDGSETWGRLLVNYFKPVDDVREQPSGQGEPVVSRAYPVSMWFNAFRAAGLVVDRLEEPPASKTPAYASDDWLESMDECSAIPTTIIIVGHKPLTEV